MAVNPIFYTYMGGACGICGKSVIEETERYSVAPGYLFDFNHIDPKKKHRNYTNLIRRKKISWVQFEEVDKCALLCKACHGAVHGQNITATIDMRLDISNPGSTRVVEHTYNGQAVFDAKKKAFQIIVEGPHELELFYLRRGDGNPEMVSRKELSGSALWDLLFQTRDTGTLTIESPKNRVLMNAKKLDEENFRIDARSEFSLIQWECASSNGNVFWRNGRVVRTDKNMPLEKRTTIAGSFWMVIKYASALEALSGLKPRPDPALTR